MRSRWAEAFRGRTPDEVGMESLAGAVGQDPHEKAAACDGFFWPVSNERASFTVRKLRHSASVVRLSRIDRAVAAKSHSSAFRVLDSIR